MNKDKEIEIKDLNNINGGFKLPANSISKNSKKIRCLNSGCGYEFEVEASKTGTMKCPKCSKTIYIPSGDNTMLLK